MILSFKSCRFGDLKKIDGDFTILKPDDLVIFMLEYWRFDDLVLPV